MSIIGAIRLRARRRRAHYRAFLRRRELTAVADRSKKIRRAIIFFSTIRNERVRLPYFLQYYRDLGVDHFLFVDNGCDDGTREYLAEQQDVSIWSTTPATRRRASGSTG